MNPAKMKGRKLVSPVLLAFILILAVATPVQTWSVFEHWDMTEAVLKEQGWKTEARDLVIDCNIATDLIVSNWNIFFPAASQQKATVRDLIQDASFNTDNTNGFHFDDLFKYDDINTRWQALEEWGGSKVGGFVKKGWGADQRDRFLCLLGIIHHAVQDFYAHSNWVKLLNPFTQSKDFTADQFPTWDEVIPNNGDWPGKDPEIPDTEVMDRLQQSNRNPASPTEDGPDDGLQTGAYEDETTGAWEHRHPSGAEGDVGKALARRASAQWKDKLLDILGDHSKKCLKDLLRYVMQGGVPEPEISGSEDRGLRINPHAVENLVLVLNALVGPLEILEHINAFIEEGGLRARIELERGEMVGFSRGTFPGATIIITAASEEVIEEILTSPDPISAAREAVRRGDLSISR